MKLLNPSRTLKDHMRTLEHAPTSLVDVLAGSQWVRGERITLSRPKRSAMLDQIKAFLRQAVRQTVNNRRAIDQLTIDSVRKFKNSAPERLVFEYRKNSRSYHVVYIAGQDYGAELARLMKDLQGGF